MFLSDEKTKYRSLKHNNCCRAALWHSIGIDIEDMDKPKIAIINSSGDFAPCFFHLDGIAKVLKEDLKAAGALPFELRTFAPVDFLFSGHQGGFVQGGRDLISYDIEAGVESVMYDGMICLASCDKTLPAQPMAAARVNIPTIVIACGYQPAGVYKGQRFDIEDLFIQSGYYDMGKISKEEIDEMSRNAIMGPGVCQGIGTANTMHVACEALGFALPGSTPVLANSPKMWETVHAAAKRIVEMVDADLKPRDLLTEANFENAVKTILAISGSTNSIKHLQAVAVSGKKDIDVFGMFEKFADKVPLLVGIKPNGEHSIDDMEAAGGTLGVMKQLESILRPEAVNVSGQTAGEILKDAKVLDESVIRPMDKALNYRPAIILAKGNVAEDYGLIKLMIEDEAKPMYFRGPAKVYYDCKSAMIAALKGEIKKGDVVVCCGFGITGTPGMGGVSPILFALDGLGLRQDVAIITDGHASGLCNAALMAVDITPEAAKGGALGLIRDGDIVVIDANNRSINVELTDEELAERRKNPHVFAPSDEEGWLKIVEERAKPLTEGGVLV